MRQIVPTLIIIRCTAVALFLTFPPSVTAASIRASFLTDGGALRDTVGVLRTAGCTDKATGTFQRAVERYSSATFDFDFGKFPKPRHGFYSFDSAAALVAALPHQLAETRHEYEFNCFDAIVALAGDSLRITVRPDEVSGPYLVPHNQTNGSFTILPKATARDAFALLYPEWYRNRTEEALPRSMRDHRVSLTAALFRCHVFPQSTTEKGLSRGVIEALRATWAREGLSFPRQFEVVLCHEVSFPQRWLVTSHAGLLFPRDRGFTYIEKAGGSGPFVRLDFDDRTALLTWFGGIFRGAERLGYTHHFATFNDSKIEMVEFLRK